MQAWFESFKADFILNFVQANRWKYLVDGLGATLTITLLAGLMGIAIGVAGIVLLLGLIPMCMGLK